MGDYLAKKAKLHATVQYYQKKRKKRKRYGSAEPATPYWGLGRTLLEEPSPFAFTMFLMSELMK